MVTRRFRAKVQRGRIEPVDPVELPEGAEVLITIPEEGAKPGEAPETPGDIWAGYDPERARQAIRASAGALSGFDRKEFLRHMHEAREQDSRGRPG